eukprot:scaffold26193_cov144-Isochrysis_galbana.AAC.4
MARGGVVAREAVAVAPHPLISTTRHSTGADSSYSIAALCSLLSRCRAPALRGGPSSRRDAGDYCIDSLLLPMWGDVSVHLLGRSFSRLMHCAEAVPMTYMMRTTYVGTYVGYLP